MRREGSWKKFPMCSASMSREPIRAYLRLYLENRRKIRFMKQRFEIQYIILQSVARNTFAVSIRTRAALWLQVGTRTWLFYCTGKLHNYCAVNIKRKFVSNPHACVVQEMIFVRCSPVQTIVVNPIGIVSRLL